MNTKSSPSLHIYLFDTVESYENLLPMSFTRPVADFRVGIDTIKEKWEAEFDATFHYLPVDYLREKFGEAPPDDEEALFIAGALIPTPDICTAIRSLNNGEELTNGSATLAFRGHLSDYLENSLKTIAAPCECRYIRYAFDVFRLNAEVIADDFRRLTAGRKSQAPDSSCRIIGDLFDADGKTMLFIEEGASLTDCTINLKKGPIYVGRNSEIMEGSHIRGPLALCDNSKIRMGSKIYEGCTFGPYCKVGGEIDNSVIFGYTNKAHDGYLGNAVVGEWCNIGAGANASNLKNDYSKIRVWNYHTHTFMRTDLQFCGPIIGDHTKIGINCMLNTATVLGVGVNLHGAGFPRVFVPSFSEGSPVAGFTDVSMKKFQDIAERVWARRGIAVTDSDRQIFEKIYQVASTFKK